MVTTAKSTSILWPKSIRALGHCILAITMVLGYKAKAQDAHYWTNEYGTRAQLLGGLVVGSVKDLSATYYNPGAIAIATEVSLEVTTDAVEFTEVAVPNGAGADIDLRSFKAIASPGLFAARLRTGAQKQNNWALSCITRYDAEFEVDARRIDSYSQIEQGESANASEAVFFQSMREEWIGFSWARKLSRKLGFGMTQYIPIRSQRQRFQVMGQLVSPEGDGTVAILFKEAKYYNFRLLWKFGASFDFRPLTLGFAVTTPSLNLFGQGSTLVNAFGTGSDLPNTELASDYQDKLDAHFKSPLSIAVGGSYAFGPVSLHLTLEWFDNLGLFKVMSPSPFRAQSNGEIINPELTHELRSITNYGLGLHYKLKQRLSFYAGFRTDFAAADENTRTDITTATWDIHHLTLGMVTTFSSVDLTLGLGYASGKKTGERTLDFSVRPPPEEVIDLPDFVDVTFRRLKVILGLSIALGGQNKVVK